MSFCVTTVPSARHFEAVSVPFRAVKPTSALCCLALRKAVPRSQKPPPTTAPLFALSADFSVTLAFIFTKPTVCLDDSSTCVFLFVWMLHNVRKCDKLSRRWSDSSSPLCFHSWLFFLSASNYTHPAEARITGNSE